MDGERVYNSGPVCRSQGDLICMHFHCEAPSLRCAFAARFLRFCYTGVSLHWTCVPYAANREPLRPQSDVLEQSQG